MPVNGCRYLILIIIYKVKIMLKKIILFLIFKTDYYFSPANSREVLITRLNLLIRKKKNIEGDINDSGFDILYSTHSNRNLLKIIQLKGNFIQKESEFILTIKATLSAMLFISFLLPECGLLFGLICNKLFRIPGLIDISTNFWILGLIFFYIFYLIYFIIEFNNSINFIRKIDY
jgi:hypothetical protein